MDNSRRSGASAGLASPPDDSTEPRYVPTSTPELAERRAAAVRGRRRRRRWIIAGAIVLLLSPAIYSYTTTMLKPSSLPLGVRSVEWLRTHHGNWLVDEVEQIYYSWNAPKKG